MRIFYYLLVFSVAMCVVGFSIVVFFSDRELGIKIFQSGFFLSGFLAALIMLTSKSDRFGLLGYELKVIGLGFGLILFGLLLSTLFSLDGSIKSFFFYGGIILMTAGIIKSFLKLK